MTRAWSSTRLKSPPSRRLQSPRLKTSSQGNTPTSTLSSKSQSLGGWRMFRRSLTPLHRKPRSKCQCPDREPPCPDRSPHHSLQRGLTTTTWRALRRHRLGRHPHPRRRVLPRWRHRLQRLPRALHPRLRHLQPRRRWRRRWHRRLRPETGRGHRLRSRHQRGSCLLLSKFKAQN
jgi:hypothetical protein